MESLGNDIVVLFMLIAANGLLVLAKASLTGSRRSILAEHAEGGSSGATLALKIVETPEPVVLALHFGINLVLLLLGLFIGGRFATSLNEALAIIDPRLRMGELPALLLALALTLFLLALLGEFVPRKVAAARPEKTATLIARPVHLLARLLSPLVILLNFCSTTLLRVFQLHRTHGQSITEEEITTILEEGTEAGVVEEAEQNIMLRVLKLGDRRVDSFMTPRTDMIWLDLDATNADVAEQIARSKFTFYPVRCKNIDDVRGVVCAKDLWNVIRMATADPDSVSWREQIRPPLFVPGPTNVLNLLEQLQLRNTEFALVVDEYGGLDGIVTLDDIVQSVLVGHHSPTSVEEQSMVERDDGSWLVDGSVPVEDLAERFKLSFDGDEEKPRGYSTLAGFMMARLGHVPRVAESIAYQGHHFEIMDMDGNRVDKVLIVRKPAAETLSPGA